jgi:hypothetical protein
MPARCWASVRQGARQRWQAAKGRATQRRPAFKRSRRAMSVTAAKAKRSTQVVASSFTILPAVGSVDNDNGSKQAKIRRRDAPRHQQTICNISTAAHICDARRGSSVPPVLRKGSAVVRPPHDRQRPPARPPQPQAAAESRTGPRNMLEAPCESQRNRNGRYGAGQKTGSYAQRSTRPPLRPFFREPLSARNSTPSPRPPQNAPERRPYAAPKHVFSRYSPREEAYK